MVKERENRSKTLGEGWGTISSTSPHAKRRILGGFGWAAAGGGALEGVQLGHKEGKKGRVGEKRLARAQDIGLVAPARMARYACRASACGATGRATSSPSRGCAGSGRQRGHTIAPHAMARQRLSVAPCGLARPNGLRPANKNQYRLNIKYFF